MNRTGSKILHGMLLATSAMVASPVIVSTAAMANPAGGSVAVGSATITNPSATQTVINQTSKRALINWNSFSVQSGASVTFNQPNAKSLTVNRVTGPGSSTIDGSLFANGNIWLLNANGILFGKGSQINVGSLLATTSELSDADFKAGNNNFTASPNPNAAVVNQGTIAVSRGGSVVLSAPRVSNEGLIQADLGTVVLGGAEAFTVDMTGDNLLRYEIAAPVAQAPQDSQGKTASALVSNSGTIAAAGGHVLMTARAAQNVQDNVINNTGMVEATSVSVHNGEVDFDAGPDGTANIGGTVDVSGTGAGQTGGTVTVTGGTVNVTDGATINASGSNGGGTVLIGGGPHGTGALAHAQRTIIGAATISADATTKGNGGNVTIWSDGTTQFNGAISARGGAQGGNGGQVETSGHDLGVSSTAKVDTTAPLGLTGDWLLDPANLLLTNNTCQSACSCGSTCVNVSAIQTSLATTNVTEEASSTLTLDSSSNITWSTNTTLSLLSQGDITIKSSIQNSANGALNIVAGWDGTTTDLASLGNNGVYGTCGSVNIGTSGAIHVGGAGLVTVEGSNVTLNGTQGIAQLGYAFNTGGGDITVRVSGAVNLLGGANVTQEAQIGNGATLGLASAGGHITIDADSITVSGKNAVAGTSATIALVSGDIGSGANPLNIDVTNLSISSVGNSADAYLLSPNGGVSVSFGGKGLTLSAAGNITQNGDIVANNLNLTSTSGSIVLTDASNDIGSATLSATGNATLYNDDDLTLEGANVTGNLTLLATGNLTFTGSVQSSNGSILAVAGWDDTTPPSGITANSTAYGNNSGSVLVGGPDASGDVAVGSANGTTSIFGYNVTVDSENGLAQIGYSDGGTGAINVYARNNVSVTAVDYADYCEYECYYSGGFVGLIGNGNYNASGAVGGNITIYAAKDISLDAENGDGEDDIPNYSIIGNLGGGTSVNGTINISAGGNISLYDSSNAYTQIGNDGENDGITVGGNINVTANGTHGISLTSDDDSWGTQIGNYASGNVSSVGGNVTVTANGGGIVLDGYSSGTQIGNYDENQDTDPTIAGDIVVKSLGGDLVLQSEGDGTLVQIGNSGDANGGTMGGNIAVNVTGNLNISAEGGSSTQIGNGGPNFGDGNTGPITGNINVTATGNITIETVCGTNYAWIGNGDLTGNSSGNVSGAIVIKSGGVLQFDAGSEDDALWIGNIQQTGGTESGNVTILAASEDDGDTNLFGDIITGDLGSSSVSGSGGNVFIGVTASQTKIGGLYYDSPNTLSIASKGSLNVTHSLENNGTGAINLVGGWDGNTTTPSSLTNANVYGNANGSVLIGGGSLTFVGSALGATTVAGYNITLNGANGAAQIGYAGSGSGNVSAYAKHDVVMTAGGCGDCYVQIGDGTVSTSLTESGNVLVQAGGNVTVTAGPSAYSYAQIGNGGDSSSGTFGGNITVTSGGAVTLHGSVDYAQIGNAGWGTHGNATGNIVVNATGNISVISGANGSWGEAQIGHGGANASGNYTGNISITSGGILALTAGNNGRYAQIGHGSGKNGSGTSSGNIVIHAAALTLTGDPSLAGHDDFVDIGNTANSGTASGNISINVTGNATFNTADGGGDVWIGDYAQFGGTIAGNVSLIVGDFLAQNENNDDPAQFIASDLSGGSVTIGITDSSAHNTIGDIDYTSANALTLLTAGSFTIDDRVQNDGSGNITIVTGWNASVAPNAVATTAGAYGNHNGSLTIGGANASYGAALGSAGGTTTVLTGNLTLDAVNAIAQIGYAGNGGGAIAVNATGNILIETQGSELAQIGNGWLNATGPIGGNIIVHAGGNLTLDAGASLSVVEISNVGGAGSSQSGNITVTAGGALALKARATNTTAQIGNEEIALSNPGQHGNASGNINVTAGSVSLNATGASTAAVIGNGNPSAYNSNVSGNVTVSTGALAMSSTGVAGANAGSDQTSIVLIGDRGAAAMNGNVVVNATGNVALSAGNAGNLIIGEPSNTGNTSGTVTVTSCGSIAATASGTRGHILIGHGAVNAGGNVNVTAAGNLSLIASGSNASAEIADFGTGSFTGDVRATGGNVLVTASGSTAYATIGLVAGTNGASANGNVTVNGANVSVTASNAGAIADIGLAANGTGTQTHGAVAITATNTVSGIQSNGGTTLLAVTGQGGVIITAAGLTTSGTPEIEADTADIVLTGAGNSVGSSAAPLLVDVSDLAIQTNNGSAYISSPTQGLSIGVGGNGIDLGSGNLTLTAAGDITQTAAIDPGAVTIVSTNGSITLTNTGNVIGTATLTATGNASLTDTSNLTIAGATVGGTLALTAPSVIGSGAISATDLTITASNGDINLGNAASNVSTASLQASGIVVFIEGGDLTIANLTAGGSARLAAASVNQTGAIHATGLSVTASNGDIDLTNTDNSFATASLTAADNATLDYTGDLTITDATVGDNLTILTTGNLTIAGDARSTNGDALAVAGWDGITTSPSAFASMPASYGNNGGSIAINGNETNASFGTYNGQTTVEADNVTLEGAYGAQIGAVTGGSGDITVLAKGNVSLAGEDTQGNYHVQIGDGGLGGVGAAAGNITVSAAGDVLLQSGGGILNYAQIGNGGYENNEDTNLITRTGDIVVNAINVILSSDEGYTQIGDGGALSGGINSANITIIASGNVSVTGGGVQTWGYAQIGNGGDSSEPGGDSLAESETGNIIVNAGGDVTVTGGSDFAQIGNGGWGALSTNTGNITVSANGNVTVQGGNVDSFSYAQIGNGGEQASGTNGGAISVSAGKTLTMATGTDGVYALIGNGPGSGYNVGDDVVLTAGSIGATGNASIAGDTADITVTNGDVGTAIDPLQVAVNDLAIQTNNGDAYILSPTQGLSIGVGGNGIDLGTGNLTLTAAGDITQTAAIDPGAVTIVSTNGSITLTNTGNVIGTATLTATGNASLTDTSNLTIAGANVGGALTLTDSGSIGQSGAITAASLTANGSTLAFTNAGNAIGTATLTATGNASLTDTSNLTIAGANVGGALTLTDSGSIGQSGAITAASLTANGSTLAFTNTGNAIGTASLTATGNASLTDTSNLTIAGANVGGALTLTDTGAIGQSGAITAASLTANGNTLAFTNTGNAIGTASLTATGNASLYDTASLTLAQATAGGNLTLLTKGNLDFVSSVQLNGGSLLAVAGWDGATTGSAAASGSAYGNNAGNITVGGSGAAGNVAVGSKTGSTTLAANNVRLSAINGYAQIGYHGGGSGAIVVNATGDVNLNGGSGTAYFAQIGDGGYQVSGSNSGAVSVSANGNVTLQGGSGQEAYAQIGNGGAESNSNSSGYSDTGAIAVSGDSVALGAGGGNASYAQIGDGGYKSGQSLNGSATIGGDIVIAAVSGVTLNGNATDAYAQIGNGGDFINNNLADGSSGTISGNVSVSVSDPAVVGNAIVATAGSGANSYVQIGNGGNGENNHGAGQTVTFNIAGDITIDDLVLTGSNTGSNGYAQIGNGDGAGSGTGNVSGNIVISQGTVFVITPGTAPGTGADIKNNTGTGTVSGTVTGYNGTTPPPPPTPPTPTSDPTTAGSVSSILQNPNTPTSFTFTTAGLSPQFTGGSGDLGAGSSSTPSPLEKLAGNAEDEDVPSDSVANSVGDSLNGEKPHVVSKTVIPGVLDEIVTLTPRNPHGIPPADENYSSWGNEALWRW
jgi:filamentous hemagglutinin family protein